MGVWILVAALCWSYIKAWDSGWCCGPACQKVLCHAVFSGYKVGPIASTYPILCCVIGCTSYCVATKRSTGIVGQHVGTDCGPACWTVLWAWVIMYLTPVGLGRWQGQRTALCH